MFGGIKKVGRGVVKHGLPLAAGVLPMGGPLAGMAVNKLMGKDKEEEKKLRQIIREEVNDCLASLIIGVADQLRGEDSEEATTKLIQENTAELADIAKNPDKYPDFQKSLDEGKEVSEVPASEIPEEIEPEPVSEIPEGVEPEPVFEIPEEIEPEPEPEEPSPLPPGKLTANFSLSEFLWSATASQKGIENTPHSPEVEENLKALCETVLQPIADHYQNPVRINSGYRSPALNAVMPGSSDRSQHCKGEAADIEIMGLSNYVLACHIRDHLPFDQLILENYTKGEPNSGWIHVSYGRDRNQRKSVLTMVWQTVNNKRKPKYLQGLIA